MLSAAVMIGALRVKRKIIYIVGVRDLQNKFSKDEEILKGLHGGISLVLIELRSRQCFNVNVLRPFKIRTRFRQIRIKLMEHQKEKIWEHSHSSWTSVCGIRAQLFQVKNSF